MKKLILLIVVVLGVWLAVNYFQTGEIALFPKAVSAAEKQVRDLEKELNDVNAQIAQAGRAAGVTGIDTTGDVSALMEQKERIEKAIAAARKQLR